MCKMFTKRTRAAYKFKSGGSIPQWGRRNFRLETHTVHARVFVSPCGARRPARLQFANPSSERCGPIEAPPRRGLYDEDTGDKLPRGTRRRTYRVDREGNPRPWARWAKRVQVSHFGDIFRARLCLSWQPAPRGPFSSLRRPSTGRWWPPMRLNDTRPLIKSGEEEK